MDKPVMKGAARPARLWLLCCFVASLLAAGGAEAAADVRIVNQEVAVLPTEGGRLQFVVVMTLENRGTDAAPEVSVALPEGAVGFAPVEGWGEYAEGDGAVVEKGGLEAGGRRTLAYAFFLPYEGNRLQTNYPVSYVSESIQLLVPPGRLAVEAADFLPQSEVLDFQGQSFRRFTRLNLHPGEAWTLSFTVLSQNAPLQPMDKSAHPSGLPVVYHDYRQGVHEAVFNLLFIIVVLLLGFVGVRSSMWRAQAVSRRHAAETLLREREAILSRLVELEEERRSGRLSEAMYEERRRQLEDRLLPIMQMERAAGDESRSRRR